MAAIEIIPFRIEHFDLLEPDPVFFDVKGRMSLEPLVRGGNAVSIVDKGAGAVLACYGYVRRKPNVYWVWMLPSERGSRNLIRLVRHFERWVVTLPPGTRIEAAVVAEFEAGIRFVKALRFEQETDEPARFYDGRRDHHLFARVTDGAVPDHSRELLEDFVLLSAGRGLHDLQLRQVHGRICPF